MRIVGWFFPLGQNLPATLPLQMDISSWSQTALSAESRTLRTQPGSFYENLNRFEDKTRVVTLTFLRVGDSAW